MTSVRLKMVAAMTELRQYVLAGVMVIGLLVANVFMPAETKTQPTQAAQSFDHSNCQYPDRWSNPVDGCDNSDPAVPECIKGMATQEAEAQCIAEFVKSHQEAQAQPAPVTIPAPVEPAKPNTCEGK